MELGEPILRLAGESVERNKDRRSVWADELNGLGETSKFSLVKVTIFHLANNQAAIAHAGDINFVPHLV